MRQLAILAPLLIAACQPAAAPRFAVASVRIENEPSLGNKSSDFYTYEYADDPLFGGPRALSTGQRVHTNGDNSKTASLNFDYDSEGKITAMRSDSNDDSLKGSAYFQYTDRDRLHLLETNQGDGPDVEVNIQLEYDEDDRLLSHFIYSWKWWFFHNNERLNISYDDRDRIKSLDGENTYILYTWSDENLITRIEVQDRGGDDDHNFLISYSDARLSRIDDGDDKWLFSYDSDQRIQRIDASIGDTQKTISYTYTKGNMLGLREIVRLPNFVNYVFGLDGRPVADLDLLAVPSYFGE